MTDATTRNAGEWVVPGVDAATADAFLKRYAPWRIQLTFESGPCSRDYGVYEPFSRMPLLKQRIVFDAIGHPSPGARLLDVGFNIGYNSLEAARRYGASCVGVDLWDKHKAIAEDLARFGRLDCKFLLESAEEFEQPDSFDYVLHFGTLYHLQNPARSIEKCARSLRSGGWLAIETIKHVDDDPALSRWIYGFYGDKTNFWALGELALREMCQLHGLGEFRVLRDIAMPILGEKMVRTICVARKR